MSFPAKISSLNSQYLKTDVEYIYNTLLENHPGVLDLKNPEFKTLVEKVYSLAQEILSTHAPDQEKILQLQRLFKENFKDPHLWIYYPSSTPHPLVHNSISITPLEKAYWVSISTFEESQEKPLKILAQKLLNIPSQPLVLDLRGNTGGNSDLGLEVLYSLCGKDYVTQCLGAANKEVYVEWRASPGNIQHVKKIVDSFSDSHPSSLWIQSIYQGMTQAANLSLDYYVEPPSQINKVNDFLENRWKHPIIVIIDKRCGSACLDFLDALKMINIPLTLIGETTSADSIYMELRTVCLPSPLKGYLGFPIKVYRNRLRGHLEPYTPDINCDHLDNTKKLQATVLSYLMKT